MLFVTFVDDIFWNYDFLKNFKKKKEKKNFLKKKKQFKIFLEYSQKCPVSFQMKFQVNSMSVSCFGMSISACLACRF